MMDKVGIFNFIFDYANQDFYAKKKWRELDCSDLESVNSYCAETSLQIIENRVQDFPFLCFLGNGNFHYLSYLHQKNFQEAYTLVLFDHHSDLYEAPLLSCGSWVSRVIQENPLCQRVILLGVSESALIRECDIPILVINEAELNQRNILNCLSEIKTSVFLSIDKDVLSEKVCQTNWDQGSMSLSMLLDSIDYLVKHKKLLGVDVCGERSNSNCFLYEERRSSFVNKSIWDIVLPE